MLKIFLFLLALIFEYYVECIQNYEIYDVGTSNGKLDAFSRFEGFTAHSTEVPRICKLNFYRYATLQTIISMLLPLYAPSVSCERYVVRGVKC